MERRAAPRPYLPSSWRGPGDQSQSTDFITRWANGHVQLTRIVRAALAVALTIPHKVGKKALTYARLRFRFAMNSALLEVLDICWSTASIASSPRCSLKFESMRRIVTTARYVFSS